MFDAEREVRDMLRVFSQLTFSGSERAYDVTKFNTQLSDLAKSMVEALTAAYAQGIEERKKIDAEIARKEALFQKQQFCTKEYIVLDNLAKAIEEQV